MAGHFLFDGEHAEAFLGEENRTGIRRAVQDILGCNLIDTAIQDLEEAASYYRRQMPKAKASSSIETIAQEIEDLNTQIIQGREAIEELKGQVGSKEQQIADIEDKLRNSAAARELQSARDLATGQLTKARKRAADAQDEVLKWLGDNGRFLVSTRITELALDHLETEETKGKLPSPYNEEFVQDLLDLKKCICDADLIPGSDAHKKVASLLNKAANHTLRSRLSGIRATLSQLKTEKARAPGRLDGANKRLAEAREDISAIEAKLGDISEKLSGIDFDEIAERERRRNQLRTQLTDMNRRIGTLENNLRTAEANKANKERDLKKLAESDDDARIFVKRHSLCQTLKARLESELREEEEHARSVLRLQINKVLQATTRKHFRMNLSESYNVSLVNAEGTQLPKSTGENQLLGLVFTAALVEFARLRQNAEDHRLLRGTVAPLVLDSPFGDLDESYKRTTGEYLPRMASQVIVLVSSSQAQGNAVAALRERVGKEYVLVRTNRASGEGKVSEARQLNGRDYAVALFDQPVDGTNILEVA
jgi:DNA sulfur modification protein DndD